MLQTGTILRTTCSRRGRGGGCGGGGRGRGGAGGGGMCGITARYLLLVGCPDSLKAAKYMEAFSSMHICACLRTWSSLAQRVE